MEHRSSSATLFLGKDSWIHRLHPFTKLFCILLTGVAVYSGVFDWRIILLLLVINTFLITSSLLLKEIFQTLWKIMVPLSLFMIPIHTFLYPGNKTVLYSVANISAYQEGLLFAVSTLLKLTVVVQSSLLFVFSTHPADLITAISQTGNSPSLAYLLGSPLLLLAGMRERIGIIQAAQQARGLHTGGNIFQRIFSVPPLILPLVTGAIVEIEQRSIALEVRGFKSTSAKTSFRILTDSTGQRIMRWAMVTGTCSLLLLRLFR